MLKSTLFLVGLAALPAHADVVTWVDHDGTRHFADHAPPEVVATTVEMPHPPLIAPAGGNDTLTRSLAYAKRRDYLRRFEAPPRMYYPVMPSEEGEVVVVTPRRHIIRRPAMRW